MKHIALPFSRGKRVRDLRSAPLQGQPGKVRSNKLEVSLREPHGEKKNAGNLFVLRPLQKRCGRDPACRCTKQQNLYQDIFVFVLSLSVRGFISLVFIVAFRKRRGLDFCFGSGQQSVRAVDVDVGLQRRFKGPTHSGSYRRSHCKKCQSLSSYSD